MTVPNDPTAGGPPAPAPQPPPAAPPGAPPPPAQPTRPAVSADQVTAALTGLTARLTGGELFAAAGALLVLVVSFLLVAFLLDGPAAMSDLAIVASAGILLLIWLRLSGSTLVGANYRLLLIALAGVLALTAAISLLYFLRAVLTPGSSYSTLLIIGELAYWIGGGLAAWGALQEWRGARA